MCHRKTLMICSQKIVVRIASFLFKTTVTFTGHKSFNDLLLSLSSTRLNFARITRENHGKFKRYGTDSKTPYVHKWNYSSLSITVFIKRRDLDQPDTFAAFTVNLKSCLTDFTPSLAPWHDQTAEIFHVLTDVVSGDLIILTFNNMEKRQ